MSWPPVTWKKPSCVVTKENGQSYGCWLHASTAVESLDKGFWLFNSYNFLFRMLFWHVDVQGLWSLLLMSCLILVTMFFCPSLASLFTKPLASHEDMKSGTTTFWWGAGFYYKLTSSFDLFLNSLISHIASLWGQNTNRRHWKGLHRHYLKNTRWHYCYISFVSFLILTLA